MPPRLSSGSSVSSPLRPTGKRPTRIRKDNASSTSILNKPASSNVVKEKVVDGVRQYLIKTSFVGPKTPPTYKWIEESNCGDKLFQDWTNRSQVHRVVDRVRRDFPHGIIDLVLWYFRTSRATLLICSLVSRSWNQSSRRFLFYDFGEILWKGNSKDRSSRLRSFLVTTSASCQTVLASIQKLHLDLNINPLANVERLINRLNETGADIGELILRWSGKGTPAEVKMLKPFLSMLKETKSLSRLRHLAIYIPSTSPMPMVFIDYIVSQRHLNSLAVSFPRLYPKPDPEFGSYDKVLPPHPAEWVHSLERVKLVNVHPSFLDWIQDCTAVTELEVLGRRWYSEPPRISSYIETNGPNLRSLSLNPCGVNRTFMGFPFSKLTSLEYLNLHACSHHPQSIGPNVAALPPSLCRSLKALVSDCDAPSTDNPTHVAWRLRGFVCALMRDTTAHALRDTPRWIRLCPSTPGKAQLKVLREGFLEMVRKLTMTTENFEWTLDPPFVTRDLKDEGVPYIIFTPIRAPGHHGH